MSIQELLTGGGGLVVLALTVIQVAPVKINPWSAIAKAIGRAINAEVLAELEQTRTGWTTTSRPMTSGRRICTEPGSCGLTRN